MTKEQILKGNELIALFDGWYRNELPKNGDINWFHDKYSIRLTKKLLIPSRSTNFKYDISWDWLIPICKKLDYLSEKKVIEWSKDFEYWCDQLDNAVTRTYEIKPVYEVVIEFIDWYNKNKSQQ